MNTSHSWLSDSTQATPVAVDEESKRSISCIEYVQFFVVGSVDKVPALPYVATLPR